MLRRLFSLILVVILAGAGLVLGTWYYTAALEEIDPKEGVYGMDGLEVWIDINARMPAIARSWACDTLMAREAAVLGGQRAPELRPYGCQPGFAEAAQLSNYDAVVKANLDQATAGLDATKAAALKACFDTRIAAALVPADIAGLNDDPAGDAASKVVVAVNEATRACADEVGK